MKNISDDYYWFKNSIANESMSKKINQARLLVCDVDGTLTNGVIYITQKEEEGRHFSILDGYGIIKAMHSGIIVSLMSGKEHDSLHVRGSQLSIPKQLCLAKRQLDKPNAIRQLQKEYNISDEQVIMFGDDIIDWNVKKSIPKSLFISVKDSPFYIQSVSDLVVPRKGGDHALRLLIDLILFIKKNHPVQELIQQCIDNLPSQLYE